MKHLVIFLEFFSSAFLFVVVVVRQMGQPGNTMNPKDFSSGCLCLEVPFILSVGRVCKCPVGEQAQTGVRAYRSPAYKK